LTIPGCRSHPISPRASISSRVVGQEAACARSFLFRSVRARPLAQGLSRTGPRGASGPFRQVTIGGCRRFAFVAGPVFALSRSSAAVRPVADGPRAQRASSTRRLAPAGQVCIDGTCSATDGRRAVRPRAAADGWRAPPRCGNVRNVMAIHVGSTHEHAHRKSTGADAHHRFRGVMADYDDGKPRARSPTACGRRTPRQSVGARRSPRTGRVSPRAGVGRWHFERSPRPRRGLMATATADGADPAHDSWTPGRTGRMRPTHFRAGHHTRRRLPGRRRGRTSSIPSRTPCFPQNVYPAGNAQLGQAGRERRSLRGAARRFRVCRCARTVVHSGSGLSASTGCPTTRKPGAAASPSRRPRCPITIRRRSLGEASSDTVIHDPGCDRAVRRRDDPPARSTTGISARGPHPSAFQRRWHGPRQLHAASRHASPPNSAKTSASRVTAISRDGSSAMAAELWDASDTSVIFDLTGDTTADPPPMIVSPGTTSFLDGGASAPTNSRLHRRARPNRPLPSRERETPGATVSRRRLPTTSTSQPEWSPPTETQIAYVATANGSTGWAIDFNARRFSGSSERDGRATRFGHAARGPVCRGTPRRDIARPRRGPPSSGLQIAFQQRRWHSRSYLDSRWARNRSPAARHAVEDGDGANGVTFVRASRT